MLKKDVLMQIGHPFIMRLNLLFKFAMASTACNSYLTASFRSSQSLFTCRTLKINIVLMVTTSVSLYRHINSLYIPVILSASSDYIARESSEI